MIGQRIRQVRQSLGLSQQQLAGKEMTRAFVSLVESGKSTPSAETLRIIAARLGKSVGYFLEGEIDPQQDQVAILLNESEAELANRPSAEKLAQIHSRLAQAVLRTAENGWEDLEARARRLLARCLQMQEQMLDSWDEWDRAIACLTNLKDSQELCRAYREVGDLAYRQEEFPRAVRAYEGALLYSAGLKSMQHFRIECFMYLGSTLFRMGKYPEAAANYHEALSEADLAGEGELWAEAAMGYGSALHRAGQLDTAYDWTRKAVEALRRAKSPQQILARHNLAVLEMDRGNWETAYAILLECQQAYREQGRSRKWASVLEDIARYWWHKGEPNRAEESCWEAIQLLEQDENAVLRGRLYRMLGKLAAEKGDLRHANVLLHISMDLFRRLQAETELALTRESMEAFRKGQKL